MHRKVRSTTRTSRQAGKRMPDDKRHVPGPMTCYTQGVTTTTPQRTPYELEPGQRRHARIPSHPPPPRASHN